eukprot:593353_1
MEASLNNLSSTLENGQGMLRVDHIENVNQMCYCMKPLKNKIPAQNTCQCCYKEYPQKDVSFYICDAYPDKECTYHQMLKGWYFVCAACFETKREELQTQEHKQNEDNVRAFRLQKVKATLNIMKQRLNDETRKGEYLICAWDYMYHYFIRKLNDDQLEEEFNPFYEEHLALHAKEID